MTTHASQDHEIPTPIANAVLAIRQLGVEWVRRYHRLEITGDLHRPDAPVLFVANHGFGGIFELNVLAIFATFDALKLDRPVTILVHQLAWTLRVGPLVEAFGGRPAGHQAAMEAFARGQHVMVMPGGDVEASKSHADRNRVIFTGRGGFARLAIEAGVPIVPIVTAGAGDTLFVLSDGQRLARALQIDKALRLHAFPISVSLPWGLSIGAVGLLPYLPLPAKLRTRVLAPMLPEDEDEPEQYAARVQAAMQEALSGMAGHQR